eukprot:1806598-Rhodomonas_salina.2
MQCMVLPAIGVWEPTPARAPRTMGLVAPAVSATRLLCGVRYLLHSTDEWHASRLGPTHTLGRVRY